MEKKIRISIMIFLAASFVGCLYRQITFYEYESVDLLTENGKFNISFTSQPSTKNVDSRDVSSWGAPYFFAVHYFSDTGEVISGTIGSLTLTDLESGKVEFTIDELSDHRYQQQGQAVKSSQSILEFRAGWVDLPYVDYSIDFEYRIVDSKSGVVEIGEINGKMGTDQYTGSKKRGEFF